MFISNYQSAVYAQSEAATKAMESELAKEIYKELVEVPFAAALKSLPDGFFEHTENMNFKLAEGRVDGRGFARIRLPKKYPMPYYMATSNGYGTDNPVVSKTLSKRVVELEKVANKLKLEASEKVSAAEHVCACVKTHDELFSMWPEAKKYAKGTCVDSSLEDSLTTLMGKKPK